MKRLALCLALIAGCASAQTLGMAPTAIRTVLTANVSLSATTFSVAVCDKVTAGMTANADYEMFFVSAVASHPCVITVVRAYQGTAADRHYTGAIVSFYVPGSQGDLQPALWGADPTGVASSTAAIQTMFDAGTPGTFNFASQKGAARYKITSTVTLTVPVAVGQNSPGAVVDLGGATLVCSQTSGPCLKIISTNIAGYQGVTLKNGAVQYVGASSSVIGILVQDFTRPTMDSVKVIGFSTSGSEGIQLKNVEEARMSALYIQGNRIGLHLTDQSTANRLDGASVVQGNTTAILIDKGSYGFTCDGNVIQSNIGVHAVEVLNATGDPDSISATRFLNNHFENNGDGTVNTRAIYFHADSGRYILTTTISANIWNTPNGSAVAQVEFAGAGTISYVSVGGNQCGAVPFSTGTASLVGSAGDNCTLASYDTALNSEGFAGLTLWGKNAAKKYNLLAGRPGAFDGSFEVDDITTGTPVHMIRASVATGWLTLTIFPLDGSQNIGSSGTRWPTGYFTNVNATNVRSFNAPIAPFYRLNGFTSGGSPTWADLQDALTASGVACSGGGNQGMTAYVIDGNNTGYGNVVSAGGGANSVFIVCDGSAWRVH